MAQERVDYLLSMLIEHKLVHNINIDEAIKHFKSLTSNERRTK